jgi:hypothetical protein
MARINIPDGLSTFGELVHHLRIVGRNDSHLARDQTAIFDRDRVFDQREKAGLAWIWAFLILGTIFPAERWLWSRCLHPAMCWCGQGI